LQFVLFSLGKGLHGIVGLEAAAVPLHYEWGTVGPAAATEANSFFGEETIEGIVGETVR
jgi:hypothetical protein